MKNFQDTLRAHRGPIFVLFVFCMMVSFSFLAARGMLHTSAAPVQGFNPGNIISDAVMGNHNSMTKDDIQRFLTAKNSCKNTDYNQYLKLKAAYPQHEWHFANGHFVCLSEELFGDGTTIGSGQTAAEIIYQAAQDYKINPQVLIVLLEKEQSLISDTYPNYRQYRSATGYGCPDTAPCDQEYYGFKNQVRKAAEMFRTVLDGGWSNYPAGKTSYIQYNPTASCGGSMVYIENRATSALYRYTPYQPNAAALAAGSGTGDICGAYGNRNFYIYFTNWFGSTQLEIPTAKYQVIPEGEYTIVSGATYDTAITAAGNTNGSNIATSKRSGQKNQLWKVQYHSDDHTYSFINAASGKALDLDGQSTKDGSNIHLYDSNSTCAQRWYVVMNSDSSKTLLSACSKTAAVSVESKNNNVQVSYNNDKSTQHWYFVPNAALADGLYNIVAGTNNQLYLDIANGVAALINGSNVQIYENNNTAAQKWQIKYNAKDGTYSIINPNKDLVLDVVDGGTSNGSNVQMYSSNDTPAQKWYILPQNNGYVIASAKSGRVLDIANGGHSSGANVQIYESNQTKAQTWSFKQTTSAQQVVDGVYEIVAGTNSQKALDVDGGVAHAKSGTNVQIFGRNQTDAQKWRITYNKTSDTYSIINITSELSLDVYSGSLGNGANIQVFAPNQTAAQRWRIVKNTDGSFTITSAKSGLALDIDSGGKHDGANVQQFSTNFTPAQKWQLVKVNN